MKYRIAVGWQIFSYVFGVLMTGTGFFLAQKVIQTGTNNLTFFIGFAVLLALFGIAMIVNTVRTLVEVDEEKVTVTNLFGQRSLALNHITGYGTGDKSLFYLIPAGQEKNLTIPPNLAGRDQLITFFTLKYPNVNTIQLEKATSQLLEDERFGTTKEERALRLKRTARIALIVNYAPVVLLLLLSFNRRYYEWTMWVVFSIPWIVALLTRQMKGIISLVPRRNNPAPSFFLALLFTVMAAFIGTVPRFDFYDLGGKAVGTFIAGGVVTLGVYAAICGDIFAREQKKQLFYLGFGLLFCGYSAMLILFTNCFYEFRPPQHFDTVIEDKQISHKKSDTYYLTLSAWGNYPDGKDFSVSSQLYNEVGRGDSIRVSLFPGKWGIPWYRMNRSDLPEEKTLITPLR